MKANAEHIKLGLKQFHGTETFYQIPLIQTRFTDGLKYLADTAECFWLLTDVSVIAKSLMDKSYFICIDFKRLSRKEQQLMGCEATISYSDGNSHFYEVHKYAFTDFPLDWLRLYFVDGTLMLPSEY